MNLEGNFSASKIVLVRIMNNLHIIHSDGSKLVLMKKYETHK